ncbi:MAG: hypothetical protein NVSMB18_02820 [Acetobacteraceae bacterium]
MAKFSYDEAFDRNIGWLTEWEQNAIRGKRVAIAGLGGVGGAHLLTLARLGIGAFNLADFDTFDIANFNRQVGATMETIGRPKLDVMAEMALSINPELRIGRFSQGISAETIDAFLDGVDLFVDGFDFFVLGIRRQVFARCAELGIPAVTAAPIGMGTGFLAFVPGGMTFEEYFRLEGQPENEQYLRFLMGVAPRGLHRSYLVDPSRIDLANKRGPSTGASCMLCAGIVTVAAVKLLLNRGNVKPAPYHHHFDPYVGKLAITRLSGGMNGPMQRAKLAIARRLYLRRGAPAAPRVTSPPSTSPIEASLSTARWAPSGDNAQPWRFEITGEDAVTVHLISEAAHNPYEYRNGQPSFLSLGMLLESMRLAASTQGRGMAWTLESAEEPHRVAVRFPAAPGIEPDPLVPYVSMRSVDRRPYRARPLTDNEKTRLTAALGAELTVRWFETTAQRFALARLGAAATDIRLRAPETFAVHQRVIDWANRHSPGGLPSGAIGMDRATLLLMRWAMQSWGRMHRLNRIAGTSAAAAQLDLLPGLRSAAFFAIAPATSAAQGVGAQDVRALDVGALIRAGQGIQRFWLMATKLGLAMQPGFATLIFAHYGTEDTAFTADPGLRNKARKLGESFRATFGQGPAGYLFLARIGEPPPRRPGARSVRRPLAELKVEHRAERRPAPALDAAE